MYPNTSLLEYLAVIQTQDRARAIGQAQLQRAAADRNVACPRPTLGARVLTSLHLRARG